MDTRAELIRFGQKIRQAREREAISVAELAARTGVDVRKITALEAGRFDPPFDVMSALADGIGVPLYALMPDDGKSVRRHSAMCLRAASTELMATATPDGVSGAFSPRRRWATPRTTARTHPGSARARGGGRGSP